MAGELGAWIPGWSLLLPTGRSPYAQDGPKFASCGAKPIQPLVAKPGLFGSLPRCNVPRLGEPRGLLPARDSWRPRDDGLVRRVHLLGLDGEGSPCFSWGDRRRAGLADRLCGPPVEGYPWDVKNGLRLVRVPWAWRNATKPVAFGLNTRVVIDKILYVGSPLP